MFSSTNNILVNLTSSLSNHIQHIRAYWSDICCISTIFSILWTHWCCHFIFSHSGAYNLIGEICLHHILLFLRCAQYHTSITSHIKFHIMFTTAIKQCTFSLSMVFYELEPIIIVIIFLIDCIIGNTYRIDLKKEKRKKEICIIVQIIWMII